MSEGWPARTISKLGLLFCVGLLAGAFALEHGLHLVPCPLCILQRYITGLIAFLFLISCLTNRTTAIRILYGLISLTSILGILVSSRQVYLQNAPYDIANACGPDLDYMFRNVPFRQSLKLLYQGSGDCARIQWQFMGFSIPAMSLLAFSVILAMMVMMFWKMRTRS